MKKRVQGDTFITHCTASYKLFISQTSTKHPTTLPGSPFFPFFLFSCHGCCFVSPPSSAAAECRERGGGAHQEHAVGAVPGHGHQRAALRLGECQHPWEQPERAAGTHSSLLQTTAPTRLCLGFWQLHGHSAAGFILGGINKLPNNAASCPASDKYCISYLTFDEYCVLYLEQQLPPRAGVPAHGKGLDGL